MFYLTIVNKTHVTVTLGLHDNSCTGTFTHAVKIVQVNFDLRRIKD